VTEPFFENDEHGPAAPAPAKKQRKKRTPRPDTLSGIEPPVEPAPAFDACAMADMIEYVRARTDDEMMVLRGLVSLRK